MQNSNKLTSIKDLIKFVTFYYYYILNYPVKPFAAYLLMDYNLRLDYKRYIDYVSYGSHYSDNIIQLRYKFNENILYQLKLSTFKRRKTKILANTRHAYLVSLKEQKLIPFTKYKIKELTLDSLFQINFDPNTIYVLSGYDISKIVEFYLATLKKLNQTKSKKYDEEYYLKLIDDVFHIVETMFNNFKNLHLSANIVFYKNYHGCRYHDCEGVEIDDDQFEYYITEINNRLKRIIKVNDVVIGSDEIIKYKYGKSIEDLLINKTKLAKYLERDSWSGDFIFENIEEFSIQDFVLSILCLTNVLSV